MNAIMYFLSVGARDGGEGERDGGERVGERVCYELLKSIYIQYTGLKSMVSTPGIS